MRGFIILLVVAVAHLSSAIYIGNCKDEDELVKAVSSDKKPLVENKVFYVRYELEDPEHKKAGHKCTKVEVKVINNVRKKYTVYNYGAFVVRTTAELQTVEGKYVVKDSKNKFVKSYVTSYGSDKDEELWKFERELRYPGITHNRSYYLDGDVWALWECNKLAPFTDNFKNDVRYVLTSKPNDPLPEDHEAIQKSLEKKPGEKGFEGKLVKVADADVATCESIPFDYDLI